MRPTDSRAWSQLWELATALPTLSQLLLEPNRARHLCHKIGGVRFDFTKQYVSLDTLATLEQLAAELAVTKKRDNMLAGVKINTSEQRSVLHTALRNNSADEEVRRVRARMYEVTEALHDGSWLGATGRRIETIIHMGIGGSHLGPELVTEALQQYRVTRLKLHYISNIDAHELGQALSAANPETTLFIIASKSFSTLETQVNAQSARSWFLERGGRLADIPRHFVAVSNNIKAAAEFGLPQSNLLPMWDWVGGRFSLWSAVGLPIAILIGRTHHEQFLAGAALADQHFASQPLLKNVPILSALLATWNYNFLGAESLALLCYEERLRLLPNFLQQLEMESNGKSVDLDGEPVTYHTMPVLWGGTGTNGQHAYHQLLHQGTRVYTADFITVAQDDHAQADHHRWLNANALAQSQAMAEGFDAPEDEPHRSVAGNHSSTVVTLDALGPHPLGTLLATYEHKVFAQAAIWHINAFDQWGVELGKNLAIPIHAALEGKSALDSSFDPSTSELIKYLKKSQNQP